MTSHDHYFSAEPASADERRTINVPLAGVTRAVQVAPGIFSPDRIDQGTSVLLQNAPQPPAEGTFLDLGCGWGPIALSLALHSPNATVYAVDVNERALDLARVNAESLVLKGVHVSAAQEVPADARFDLIWSNPPIRVGKAILHDLMRTWLPRLTDGGAAYLVVQKNLGSDSLQKWITENLDGLAAERFTSVRGFRILKVTRDY
ncbi:class I SAM-dependent methyltransferase [Yimella sp. cx-51]|uniref:class I SAM-dependent methyltransferase n=1 Tax=Yimella sp. cx-51 TaxID=2770551 RepID=UPI00165D7601|nr:methyltransferase [Yimella sp. cx-51]MBC9957219.1 methyltransferase [Yimella sp. cx-51]QTH37135.1 methyltransferase [Yimella sp. cx-51]